jgi:hypothetical protein
VGAEPPRRRPALPPPRIPQRIQTARCPARITTPSIFTPRLSALSLQRDDRAPRRRHGARRRVLLRQHGQRHARQFDVQYHLRVAIDNELRVGLWRVTRCSRAPFSVSTIHNVGLHTAHPPLIACPAHRNVLFTLHRLSTRALQGLFPSRQTASRPSLPTPPPCQRTFPPAQSQPQPDSPVFRLRRKRCAVRCEHCSWWHSETKTRHCVTAGSDSDFGGSVAQYVVNVHVQFAKRPKG